MSNTSNYHDKQNSKQTNEVKDVVFVDKKDLPISCPMPEDTLWNMHPKVYIPLDKVDSYQCPYCGRQFHLNKEETK